MRCEETRSIVGDYIDGALAPVDRRAVERHLDVCEACRSLVADLRAIQAAAFTLERPQPPARVWAAIQARVAGEPPAAGRVLAFQAPRRAMRVWMAAAAALLVVTTAGLYTLIGPAADAPPSVAGTEAEDLVASVEANLQAAESHYEKAIADLQTIAATGSDTLDPQLAAVLQKNLQVVDQAIGESRAALREQPASQNAQESLFDAMRTKVALLQQTVELINEMRKGNQAEAGRLIQGISPP